MTSAKISLTVSSMHSFYFIVISCYLTIIIITIIIIIIIIIMKCEYVFNSSFYILLICK